MAKERGVPFSVHSVTLIMRYLHRKKTIKEFVGVFEDVDLKSRDPQLCNLLLEVMLRSGRSEDARKVLDDMLVDTQMIISGDVVLSALLWRVRYFEIHSGMDNIVGLVLRFGELGFFPSLVDVGVCNIVLSGLGRRRDLGRMNKLMGVMMERKVSPNVATFGIPINNLCKCRKVSEALEIFKRMRGGIGCDSSNRVFAGQAGCADVVLTKLKEAGFSLDIVSYNDLISGFCWKSRVQRPYELLEDMETAGVKPNTRMFNALLRGFSRKTCWRKAFELTDWMTEKTCRSDYVTMEILTEWLSAVGEMGKLKSFSQGYEVSVAAI
ncbi:hypothetical protein MLD38_018261 [Melastoma candidum]|uniref:Uncharacterized protein n=1 Tax=Melastoma candidum TaxID=119954 RepID=A0ACB9QUD1_9MYRT|nr:hypothetical protein MLD38_018261 [Melastoma candidum]